MYMYQELNVRIGSDTHKVFMQDGFFNKRLLTSKIHRHNYAEVHFLLGGDVVYRIGEEIYRAKNGSMLVIPAGVFHAGVERDENAHQAAFQIDCEVSEFGVYMLGSAVLAEFFSEIDRCISTEDYTGISAYITLFCRHFLAVEPVRSEHISDPGFLIFEFFSNKYSEDIRLGDLAASLHLSERQTERLVIDYMGAGFRETLTSTRVNMAKQLLAVSDMSLGEIASYVGYRTYAGFWKAMKKHGLTLPSDERRENEGD